MARIPFQKPKTIHWEILSDRYGRLMAEPFEKGYGQTVGHSLRRTLLSIIPGAAVTWVRIKDVADSGNPIPGVQEGTVDVVFNGKTESVTCTMKRIKRCVEGLKNPIDDCPDASTE